MTIAGIVDKVRIIMNEAGEEDSLHLLSEDTVKLTEYIKSVIPDAIDMVTMVAPLRCINTSQMPISSTGLCVSLALPNGFLRLASLKFKEWKRAVSYVFSCNSEMYKIQHNPVTTAGVNKPCCVFAYDQMNPVIECFPPGVLEYFHYVKSAVSESENGISAAKEELYPAICYMCASLVYTIFENPNTAEKMKTIAIELIPKQ